MPICEVKLEPARKPGHSYELKWWDHQTGKSAYVHFAEVIMIRAAILDLAVLSDDGTVNFPVKNMNRLTSVLSPAWLKHAEMLERTFKSEVKRYKLVHPALSDNKHQIPRDVRENAEKVLAPCCSNTSEFKAQLTSNCTGFTVNIQRGDRLTPVLAADVLRSFALYQSRTGFNHDVAVTPDHDSLDEGGCGE